MDESAAPVKRPRFPWLAALLCAACVGVAAWTWMRYSYAWNYTGAELAASYSRAGVVEDLGRDGCPDVLFTWSHPNLVGKYVMVDDTLQGKWSMSMLWGVSLPVEDTYIAFLIALPHGATPPRDGHRIRLTGRMVSLARWAEGGDSLVLDTCASRFHPASIAGLVVFAVYLRTWVKGRRVGAAGHSGHSVGSSTHANTGKGNATA